MVNLRRREHKLGRYGEVSRQVSSMGEVFGGTRSIQLYIS